MSVSKTVGLADFLRIREQLRAERKTVVLTNGHFDILHVGHARYLARARALGDCLVIGLNSDASTRRLKGEKRPIVPQDERAEMLAALACVDFIVVFDEQTAENLVAAVKPDVYAKGGDYDPEIVLSPEGSAEAPNQSSGGKALPEANIVAGYGGRVAILPFQIGHSTTNIVDTIIERYCGR